MRRLFYFLLMALMVLVAVSCKKDKYDPKNVKAVTVAEFIAAPKSDTQVYELVGTIGSTINTTYGNFDLTDETGTVYIYGLTATYLGYGFKNDGSFSSLGLKWKDKIRIRGYRGAYEEKVEMEYAWFIEKLQDGGGGDLPVGNTVSVDTNSDAEIWTSSIDNTYGSGYATTVQGLLIGFYKHTSTTTPVAPNANHIRIYKNNVLTIKSTNDKKFKKIVIGCAPDSGDTSYCFDLTGLEGGTGATANKSAKTVTWTGSSSKVILLNTIGQIRVEKLTVEFE